MAGMSYVRILLLCLLGLTISSAALARDDDDGFDDDNGFECRSSNSQDCDDDDDGVGCRSSNSDDCDDDDDDNGNDMEFCGDLHGAGCDRR